MTGSVTTQYLPGKEFEGLKMYVQRKANFTHLEAVASIIWPLISSDGDTGRAIKMKMREMHIAYRFLVSGLSAESGNVARLDLRDR